MLQYKNNVFDIEVSEQQRKRETFIYLFFVSNQLSDKRRDRLLLGSDGERTQRVEGY